MSKKKLRVLYVCPFAHYSGHHPHVATVEPAILEQAGVDATLLTFCGIINGTQPRVKHAEVLPSGKHRIIHRLLWVIRERPLSRWGLMMVETFITLLKAVRMSKKDGYDIIHLRDGEPFLFLSHLASLRHRGLRWAISVTAAIVFKPVLVAGDMRERPYVWLYTMALKAVNSARLWRWLYRWSMGRNRFILMPQNDVAAEGYRQYMDGVFSDRVVCVPWGISSDGFKPDKVESRKELGIPLDAFVLLSFGAPHSGKDMVSIFKAVASVEGVFLLHGGKHTFSLGSNPIDLAEEYGLSNRAMVISRYIREDEKPYLFGAADAMVLSYTKAFASTSSMIWESAKYRLPVISSDANRLGEDVLEYDLGMLFEAENAMSMAAALREYMALPREKVAMLMGGCERFLADYSEDKWAEKCIVVYKELLRGVE